MELVIICAVILVTFGLWAFEKVTHKNEDENKVVILRNFRVPDPERAKEPSATTLDSIKEWTDNVIVSTPDVIVPDEMNSQFEDWEFDKVSPSTIKGETEEAVKKLEIIRDSLTQEEGSSSFERFRVELVEVIQHVKGIVSIRQTLENTDEALRPSFYDAAVAKLNKSQAMANEICKGLILTLVIQAKEVDDGGLYIYNPETLGLTADIATKTKRLESELRSFVTKQTKKLLYTNEKQVTAIVPFASTTPVTENFDTEFKVV